MTTPDFANLFTDAEFIGLFENHSQEWHDARNQPGVISGSEVGTILGLSPFTSPYTLWAQKTNRIDRDIPENDAMLLGTFLESGIREMYAYKHPEVSVIGDVGSWRSKLTRWAQANPDGVCIPADGSDPYLLEIKHTSQYWDSIPEHYKAQAYWYLYVTGLERMVFAVDAGGRYAEFELLYDEFEVMAMLDRVTLFRNLIMTDVAPDWDGSDSTYETSRKLSPGVETRDEELGDLGIHLVNAQTAFESAETLLREMKSRTIEALNGAKNGTVDGKVIVTLGQRGNNPPFLTIKKEGK
jgi:putative phage-type endonuclease